MFQDNNEEAHYHFILSDMLDLVRQYGYSKVINDLDAMISDEVNKLLEVSDAVRSARRNKSGIA